MQVYPADFNIEKAIDKSKMRFSQFNEGTIHATKICELFHLSLQLIIAVFVGGSGSEC